MSGTQTVPAQPNHVRPARVSVVGACGSTLHHRDDRWELIDVGFYIDSTYFQLNNPYSSGTAIAVTYRVDITGSDDPGHDDYVQVWGSDGTKWVDEYISAPATTAGNWYGTIVNVPPLEPGYSDISVTLPDGTAAGATIIVQ